MRRPNKCYFWTKYYIFGHRMSLHLKLKTYLTDMSIFTEITKEDQTSITYSRTERKWEEHQQTM